MSEIPRSHPRYKSLMARERLVAGLKAGMTSEAGLLAHGRGEAFDYLLGERTHGFAQRAIAMTSALLIGAKHPVLSVNGNSGALAGPELAAFVKEFPFVTLEVNLFHHSEERSARIADHLRSFGVERVLESCKSPAGTLEGIESPRRFMSAGGIADADVVLVALEDGDRCEALVKSGRTVIAIDLNPLSRTAQMAQVSIVDELTRVIEVLGDQLRKDADASPGELGERMAGYDNRAVLDEAVRTLRGNLD